MRSNKKAQSALEFLTTYGWAFLVILIMIAALSYFGVLEPRKYLPEVCRVDPGFTCNGVVFDTASQQVQFGLINSQIPEITLENIVAADVLPGFCVATAVTVDSTDDAVYNPVDVVSGSTTWQSEVEAIVTVTCPPGTFANQQYIDAELLFPYRSSTSNLLKRLKGQLSSVSQ